MKKFLSTLFITFLCFIASPAQENNINTNFVEENISFISKPSGYKMAGTFSYPSKPGKFPAILLVWGTGPHTRDEIISNSPTFKIMANYFNKHGYAILRIDKRSFGKSEGPDEHSEQFTTTEELADDIYSALQFLKIQEQVDTNNIGLIGHSEGAWISEMIALEEESIKWIALIGAPIIPFMEIQTQQMCDNLIRLGGTKEMLEKVQPEIIRYMNFIKTDYTNDSTYYALGKSFLMAHGMEDKDINHQVINKYLDGFKTPWYQYFLRGNPGELIKQLNIPVLFVYGSKDENVSLNTNLLPLLDIINQYEKLNVTIKILSGLDHYFQVKEETGWDLSEELLYSISSWIKRKDY